MKIRTVMPTVYGGNFFPFVGTIIDTEEEMWKPLGTQEHLDTMARQLVTDGGAEYVIDDPPPEPPPTP